MVDQKTKEYWRQLLGDYGELLTREIPKRTKMALLMVASADASTPVKVVLTGHGRRGDLVSVEGIGKVGTTNVPFVASFAADGTLTEWSARMPAASGV